jgi:tRNA U34 5-methylaminomethyl-2-thiouridine-forming methyltransferase MnmC
MQLVVTGDGSHTFYLPALEEHYHSKFGALTESMHVFVQSGLLYLAGRKEIGVLEIGFGTGLNALLTFRAAVRQRLKVYYHALEKYPIDTHLIKDLNYPALLTSDALPNDLFDVIHDAPWNTTIALNPGFRLHKILDDLIMFTPGFRYDLIYFDAFAPDKQPELWSAKIFERLYNNLNPGGVFITYCVKGTVKRLLKSAGFRIEKLPGPPGKREILRGIK